MLNELSQVHAIADPLRMRILAAFCRQQLTTKQVAKVLDETVNKLYHHVDTLEKAGLIQLMEKKKNRGTLEKYYRAVAAHFTLSPQLFEVRLQPASSTEVTEVMFSAALQSTLSEVKESLEKKRIRAHDKHGFFTRLHIQTSRTNIETLQEALQKWIDTCRAANTPEGDTAFGLTVAFYPVSLPHPPVE